MAMPLEAASTSSAASSNYLPAVVLPAEVSEIFPAIGLNAYQRVAFTTDKLPASGLELPILGLFGEVGGLLTVFKKRKRDQASFNKYAAALLEEFGDVIWYFSSIASRAGLKLAVLAQRMFRNFEDWDIVDEEFGSFGDIQSRTDSVLSEQEFSKRAIALAGTVGNLLNDFRNGSFNNNRDKLSAHLVDIFTALMSAADAADVNLEEAAGANLKKIFSRWPIKPVYPPRLDIGLANYERFPSILEFLIAEEQIGDRSFVLQRYNDVYIGDRLTDNKQEFDDYRFHDVFHLSFAVHLGWSPVLRSLLRLKRKSDPNIDENQDGARAILIEEGVATFIFGHGVDLGLFENIPQVDYDLLKYVTEFVRGYEVQRCQLWQWERAILDAFKVFRQLKIRRRGRVIADLDNHTLEFFEQTNQI
ncbi:hypothetical protein SAMN05518854_103130 [Variovorax sp. YR266]|uniref:nucleoside triphosphate pyrophosphohydrolase family protein n=1 Tax=Variovorax sp. YR266 TaxID=1884386 RepID=UPI00089D11C8|nr:nucleoside triphosphate pyrophosphohydrolase family protein [Variovorax sp. YR266]SDY97725.1 hypothetical protein SAMN05518854_103130 [Variovorax sp. YR266]